MRLSDVLFAYSMCRAPSSNTSPGRRKGSCNLNGISKAGGNTRIRTRGVGQNWGPHARLLGWSISVLFWNATLSFLIFENSVLKNTFKAGK